MKWFKRKPSLTEWSENFNKVVEERDALKKEVEGLRRKLFTIKNASLSLPGGKKKW